MTIPASQLVDITSRVVGGGLSGRDFVGLLLTKDTDLQTNTAVPFYSQSAVGDYFGFDSDEYKLAGNYFLADSNSSRKPNVLWFYRYTASGVGAFLRGGKVDSLASLQAITNGGLSITIDGTEESLTGLDFSSATNFSDVATIVDTALSTSGSCSWNSNFQAFVITSATTSSLSSITVATGTAAEAMGLTDGLISAGADAKTLTQALTDLTKVTLNFWSYMPVWDETAEESLEIAKWNNNRGIQFLYVMVDKSTGGATTANNDACLGKKVADYIGICPVYNTKALGSAIMGIGASIDVAQFEGRKTWAYKAQSGLDFTVDDETEAQNLLGNGYNFYGNYATSAEQFKLLQNGQCSGDAKWLDTYYGQCYIKDGLQISWLNILMASNTIPYTERGYTQLRGSAMDIINEAKNSGFIREGVTLGATQIATVQSQAGLDISNELQNQGWYLQILDPSAQVRAERGSPIINFWYCDGGSIQFIQGSSTVIL